MTTALRPIVRFARPRAMATARRIERWWAGAAALWAAGYALINATAALPAGHQLWWYIRQGELTLATGHAVLSSSWSWTAGDVSWIPNSWGWGALLAIAYRGGGLAGVVAFVLAAQLVVLSLAWHVFGRLGLRVGPLRVAALVLLSLSMAGWANGQSELADYAVIFGFAAVCLSRRLRRLGGWRRSLAFGLIAFALAAIWENLHLGGLVSIIVFVAVFFLVPLGRRVRADLVVAASVGAGAAVGVLATPAGTAGIAKSLVTASKSRAEHYAAWGALFAQPGAYNYEPELLALVIGALAVALLAWRREWLATGILALAAIVSVLVVRTGSDLVILSLLAGGGVLAALPRLRPSGAGLGARLARWRLRLGAGALAAAVGWLVVAGCVAVASVLPSWRLTGIDPADLAAIPSGARVFASIDASDVIDTLRPDLQVTIDSRNDLYPVGEFEYARSLFNTRASDAPDWFADNRVTAVFLAGTPARESRTRLAGVLTDAGWRSRPGVHGLVLLSPASR